MVFAEAGVGTGKTIVYLLYAICYARYTGRPAVIACADESLIEQLVKSEGDIQKLTKYLDLTVDVRLAKSQNQYLCLKKLDHVMMANPTDEIKEVFHTLPEFVHDYSALQKFSHYGDRKNYFEMTDDDWNSIAWDSFQDCFSCEKRHRCGLTLTRDYYRKATDLIICSHDFYMEHVWTQDARKREGQLPLLPEASSVVFDEGHLLEFAAQKALTYRVKEAALEMLLSKIATHEIREEFALLIEQVIEQNNVFFKVLKKSAKKIKGSSRLEITLSNELQRHTKELYTILVEIGNELVFESETYTIDHYELNIVSEYLDQMEYSLGLLLKGENAVIWIESSEEETTLVIMPRTVEEVLNDKVFSKHIPFIFSSATLSQNNSFDYIASSIGVQNYLSFTVESPFDYENQMIVEMPIFAKEEDLFSIKLTYTIQQLHKTNGRALLLFNTKEELQQFKNDIRNHSEFKFLFEGDQEISELVSRFQNEEETILCAEHLWEGLDVPGSSLSNVIIWSLPFPPNDPVFQAKRKAFEQPFWNVDVPYMILRLRQGVGRLIRSHKDKGSVSIYIPDDLDANVMEKIKLALPIDMKER